MSRNLGRPQPHINDINIGGHCDVDPDGPILLEIGDRGAEIEGRCNVCRSKGAKVARCGTMPSHHQPEIRITAHGVGMRICKFYPRRRHRKLPGIPVEISGQARGPTIAAKNLGWKPTDAYIYTDE
jgi:hypothetical protein